MTLNTITKIKENAGDYLVLTDYGSEGMKVSHQAKTAKEAAKWMLGCGYCSEQAVVKLVRIKIEEPE